MKNKTKKHKDKKSKEKKLSLDKIKRDSEELRTLIDKANLLCIELEEKGVLIEFKLNKSLDRINQPILTLTKTL